MKKLRIMLFFGDNVTSNIIYNTLKDSNKYEIVGIIMDAPVSIKKMIRYRIRKQGILHTGLQLFFQVFVGKPMRIFSKSRIRQILASYKMDVAAIDFPTIRHTSINDISNIEFVNRLSPDIIFVNGTRIISKKIIEGVKVPIINMHVGITPKYRGVHGAYWAFYNNDAENAGTTIHFIDAGVDTGKIIKQGTIAKDKHDNFSTYPYLQVAKGIELLIRTLDEFAEGSLTYESKSLKESHQYYHPTIFEYLYGLIFKKVK